MIFLTKTNFCQKLELESMESKNGKCNEGCFTQKPNFLKLIDFAIGNKVFKHMYVQKIWTYEIRILNC